MAAVGYLAPRFGLLSDQAATWLTWFGIGYVLHLVGDMFTKSGIPLFGPFSKRKVSLFPMRTGGDLEALIGGLLGISTVLLALQRYGGVNVGAEIRAWFG